VLKPLFNSKTLPILEKMAAFGERRQEVLASNIANIDTPGYKTRDLPVEAFQEALAEAMHQLTESKSPTQSVSLGYQQPQDSTANFEDLFPQTLFQASESLPHNVTFQDGGNRSIEHEVMEMTKNAMMQNFVLEILMSQMNDLQSVISEKP